MSERWGRYQKEWIYIKRFGQISRRMDICNDGWKNIRKFGWIEGKLNRYEEESIDIKKVGQISGEWIYITKVEWI